MSTRSPRPTTTSPTSLRLTPDLTAAVEQYDPAVAALATRIAGEGRSRRYGAEYDDLFQEGRLSILLALREGKSPSLRKSEHTMRDYVRFMGRLRGAIRSQPEPREVPRDVEE